MTQALLLIDIQNDYFPGGNMELVGMDEAATNARAVLERFRADDRPVFFVQHLSQRPGATFFVPGTPGVEINDAVMPREDEPVITKHFPNAFRQTELLAVLREAGIDELVICGAMTQMCIDATTRAAFDLGYGCTVAEDACATRDLTHNGEVVPARQVQAAFMAALAMPYASIRETGMLLAGDGRA